MGNIVTTLVRASLVICLGILGTAVSAQPHGEATEPTPEALDAAFTRGDAARVAAGFTKGTGINSSADPLASLAMQADFVFRGNVVAQTYEYDARGTPFTRTTFVITEALKGEHVASQLTLVQPGGPSRDRDIGTMVADAQYFNVVEEELMFVNLDPDNQRETKRVAIMNRFRIHENKVFSEDGFGVIVEPRQDGSYRLG